MLTFTRALRLALALAAALVVAGCDDGSRLVTLQIDHYEEACAGDRAEFCLRVLQASDAPKLRSKHARLAEIDGFEYRWGSVYELRVLMPDPELHSGPPELLEVIAQTPVEPDARFLLTLSPEFVERVDDEAIDLVASKHVRCETRGVCKAVATALAHSRAFQLELSHPATTDAPLVAHAVEILE